MSNPPKNPCCNDPLKPPRHFAGLSGNRFLGFGPLS